MLRPMLLALATIAWSQPMDVRPQVDGPLPVEGVRLEVVEGRLLREGETLATELVERPRVCGAGRLAFSTRDGGLQLARAAQAWAPQPVHSGAVDRIAWSEDCTEVVFVSSAQGVAAVFAYDVEEGRLRQLSNLHLGPRRPGEPPTGFVPVPTGPPSVLDGVVQWQVEGRTYQVPR